MCKFNICDDFKGYIVTGLNTKDQFVLNLKTRYIPSLQTDLFGDRFEEVKIDVIQNKGKTILSTSGIEIIKEIAKNVTNCNCGKLSLMFIGHSHGSKLVSVAYQELYHELIPEQWSNIYTCSVLLTLGGNTNIPQHLSQNAFNVEFVNDVIAKSCASVGLGVKNIGLMLNVGPIKGSTCLCCKEKDKPLIPTHALSTSKREMFRYLFVIFFNMLLIFLCFLLKKILMIDKSIKKKDSSLSTLVKWKKLIYIQSTTCKHLIKEYVVCERWKMYLRQKVFQIP